MAQPALPQPVAVGYASKTVDEQNVRMGYMEIQGLWNQKFGANPNTMYDGTFRHASSNKSEPGSYAWAGLRDCSVDEWIGVVILQKTALVGDVIDAWAYAYQ